MEDHSKAVYPLQSGLLNLYLLNILTTKRLSDKNVLEDGNYTTIIIKIFIGCV